MLDGARGQHQRADGFGKADVSDDAVTTMHTHPLHHWVICKSQPWEDAEMSEYQHPVEHRALRVPQKLFGGIVCL